MESYTEEFYKGCKIEICFDEDAENPRTWCDHFTKVVVWSHNYAFGDEKPEQNAFDFQGWMDAEGIFYLPVYAYVHSGITISTGPFSCPWDSGQIGFIYAEKEEVEKWFNESPLTEKTMERIYPIMEAEIKELDAWLTGQVFGFRISGLDGMLVDSCWGFYGDSEGALTEARRQIDAELQRSGVQLELFPEYAAAPELLGAQ